MSGAVTVSALHVYPVKSCRGISLTAADVGRMGIRHDRQWMFVDDGGMFVAQRAGSQLGVEVRTMCLIETEIADGRLILTAPEMPSLETPLEGQSGPEIPVRVWDSHVSGTDQGSDAAEWATEYLSRERPGRYRLVRMPDDGIRPPKRGTSALAYADAYPFLVISEASLEDLNRRLEEPVPMERFRPNLVLQGCDPYGEDRLERIRAGQVELVGMTLCERCPLPTTNQRTAERGKEPLRTLATYRRMSGGVMFGRNFNHASTGVIRVGDPATPA